MSCDLSLQRAHGSGGGERFLFTTRGLERGLPGGLDAIRFWHGLALVQEVLPLDHLGGPGQLDQGRTLLVPGLDRGGQFLAILFGEQSRPSLLQVEVPAGFEFTGQ